MITALITYSFGLSSYSIFCTRFQNSYVITTIHSSTVYILPPHLSHKPYSCVTVSHFLKHQKTAVQLLSKNTSHNLHRAEHSRHPSKRKLRHNVAPIKNTLPQYNSVARCKIFTILTYVALFCTIRDKNYCNFHHCFLLFQKLSANS